VTVTATESTSTGFDFTVSWDKDNTVFELALVDETLTEYEVNPPIPPIASPAGPIQVEIRGSGGTSKSHNFRFKIATTNTY